MNYVHLKNKARFFSPKKASPNKQVDTARLADCLGHVEGGLHQLQGCVLQIGSPAVQSIIKWDQPTAFTKIILLTFLLCAQYTPHRVFTAYKVVPRVPVFISKVLQVNT